MASLWEFLWGKIYLTAVLLLLPLNLILAVAAKRRYQCRSVAHFAEIRHIPHHFVQLLNRGGVRATFFGLGTNPHWSECDVHLPRLANPIAAALRDTRILWTRVASHEVIHLHCMMGLSPYLWEVPLLKLMGRRIIAHFRGCEPGRAVL